MHSKLIQRLSLIAAVALLPTISGCVYFEELLAGDYDAYELGMGYYHRHRFDEAREFLSTVSPRDGRYQNAQITLGLMLESEGKSQEAMSQLFKARRLDPAQFDRDGQAPDHLRNLYGASITQWSMETNGETRHLHDASSVILSLSAQSVLRAIDTTRRRVVWEKALGRRDSDGEPTVAFDEKHAYVVTQKPLSSELIAINKTTGVVDWSSDLGTPYKKANPTLVGATLYVGVRSGRSNQGALQAYRKESGELVWTTPTDGIPGQSLAVGESVCTLTSKQSIVCVSGGNGKKQWSYDLPADPRTARMATDGTRIFIVVDSTLNALTVNQPTPLAWQHRLDSVYASALVPSADGSKVYVETRDATIAFDSQTGDEVWHQPHPRMNVSWNLHTQKPALYGKKLVGWGTDFVFGIDPETGKSTWQAGVGQQLCSEPITDRQGAILVATCGNKDKIVALAPNDWK